MADLAQRITAARQRNQQPKASTAQIIGAALGGLGGFSASENPVLAKRKAQKEALEKQNTELMKSAKAQVPLQIQTVKDMAEEAGTSGRFRTFEEFAQWFMSDIDPDKPGSGFGGKDFINDIALNLAIAQPELSAEQARVKAVQMVKPALQAFVSPSEAGAAEGRKETAKAGAILGRSPNERERMQLAGIEEPDPVRPQSPLGKMQFDRRLAAQTFGEDSPQVRAFDEAMELERRKAEREAAGEPPEGPKLTDIRGVRQEYTKASGEFVNTQNAYGRILSTPDTAAGDVALVINFMKMLDPGSVVREGEFATAAAAAGLDDRLVQLAARVDNGERLTKEQRADFRMVADRTFQQQLQTQKLIARTFRELAIKLGMDPAKVVIPFIRQDFADTAPVERQATTGLDTSSPDAIAGADTEAVRNFVQTATADELDALSPEVRDAIAKKLRGG